MNTILRLTCFVSMLFGASALTPVANAQSEGCDKLFISEYIEGWGNNKALELYNPPGAGLDLSDYRLERYSNGATAAAENQKLQLSGYMPENTVIVIVLDKQNPDGKGFEAPVWDDLAEAADLWVCPVYEENNTMYFNGNDALVLRQISTNSVMDVFGVVGDNPGDDGGWGIGEMTRNHTLIRKTEVVEGDVVATDAFPVVDEWDGTLWSAEDTLFTTDFVFDNLGTHTCECGTSSVSERITAVDMDVFPNPATGETMFVRGGEAIREVILHNLAGQAVMRHQVSGERFVNVSLSGTPVGMYLLEVVFDKGARVTQRVVRK